MSEMKHLDQYLKLRKGRYYYVRRVPNRYRDVDSRTLIKMALGTGSREVARARRDGLAEADEQLWASLKAFDSSFAVHPALGRYEAAKARALARGFMYYPVEELTEATPTNELLARIILLERSLGKAHQSSEADALLGIAPKPSVRLSEAFDLYCNKITVGDHKGKSPAQRENWRKVKHRAVKNFIKVRGDKPMSKITRADGQAFYEWWGNRIDPKDGSRPMSGNSGNKDLTNLNILFKSFWSYGGEPKRDNPFADLRFKNVVYKSIPPFSAHWIETKLLADGALSGLNPEARLVLCTLMETGCRPSEIVNLRPENIVLDHDVPHLRIRPTENRKLKSKSSSRDIPLMGVSLEAMKLATRGFPKYRDKETLLSNTLMKFFKANNLLETPDHRVYSLRHAFEKRMQEAELDYGLRCILMGHHNTRPSYGDGGSLVYRRDQLAKITLAKSRLPIWDG